MQQKLSNEKSEHQVNNVKYTVTSVFKEKTESEDLADKMKRLILNEKIEPKTKKD